MSETPVARQTVIDKHRREQIGSPAADSHGPGSRSVEAGGALLKALAADLGTVASRLRLMLAARHRRPQPPRSRVSSRPGMGRVFVRVSMVLLGVLLLCSGALSAAMLWVIFGSPLESRRSHPEAPGLQAQAPHDASLSRSGTDNISAPSRPGAGPVAEAAIQPSPSSAGAAEQEKPAEEPKAGSNQPQPVATETQDRVSGAGQQEIPGKLTDQHPGEPQDRGPGAGQQESSAALTDQRPAMQCSVDLCAARYRSFSAADCTYQPHGGGPRSICELGAQPFVARPQLWRVATDPNPKMTDARPAAPVQPLAKSVAPDRAGSQCNQSLCAATYRSFNAADCTYAPYGGGPRAICDLSKASDDDAPQQTSRAATDARDSTSEANDTPVAGTVQEIAEPAAPDRAGPQCNRALCAAAYQSFHAADCTYQPRGGGPRRICEP